MPRKKKEIVLKSRSKTLEEDDLLMNTFTPLCTILHERVKEFFQRLHGHQSKTLSMFVMGAIRAESIVLPKVAEALLEESDAKAPSIERRLQRFLSNKKIETKAVWKIFIETVLPFFL